MRFGRTLKKSIYEPWREQYIDYKALKKLLRESDVSDQDSPTRQANGGRKWTEEDEGAFVEELINVQLEKVNNFQVETYKQLRDRTSKCESRLEALVSQLEGEQSNGEPENNGKQGDQAKETQAILKEVLEELDRITKETNELEKYSRINFTGFLKAAKKHDRKRGSNYRVRPLLQVRLAALPFNSEDYSPLLYRLSAMYSFVRQHFDGASEDRSKSFSESQPSKEYKSYKCAYGTHRLLLETNLQYSLGAPGEPPGGEDLHSATFAGSSIQPSNLQNCRGDTDRPDNHIAVF